MTLRRAATRMGAWLTLLLATAPAQARPRPSPPARQDAPSRPSAPDRRSAKAYAEEGRAAYARGDFLAAAAAWEAAYALRPVAGLLFNRAQALRMAGALRDSLDTYRRFLAVLPAVARSDNLPPEGEVRQRMAELEQLLAPPPAAPTVATAPEPSATPATPATALAEPARPAESPSEVSAATASVAQPERLISTGSVIAAAPVDRREPGMAPEPVVVAAPVATAPAAAPARTEASPSGEAPLASRPAPAVAERAPASEPLRVSRPQATAAEVRTVSVTDRPVLRVQPVASAVSETTPPVTATTTARPPTVPSVAVTPPPAPLATRRPVPARRSEWLAPTLWTAAAAVALGGGVLWMLSESQAAEAISVERTRPELDQRLQSASALRSGGLWLGVAAGTLAVTATITLAF